MNAENVSEENTILDTSILTAWQQVMIEDINKNIKPCMYPLYKCTYIIVYLFKYDCIYIYVYFYCEISVIGLADNWNTFVSVVVHELSPNVAVW